MRNDKLLIGSLVGLLAACADAPTAPPRVEAGGASLQQSEGRGVFQRYVAIGTSISMGWASDGVLAASQRMSWPAQLARLADRELTQPYIQSPGCRSPLVAPLLASIRVSGESAAAPAASFLCAPLEAGVTLPTQNLSISSALAAEALLTTPETKVDPFYSKLYPRVLPPGETQVSAMVAQNPKIVSVEFGTNEVFGARSGIAIPGVTLVPLAQFAAPYAAILDEVGKLTKMAVLVGLIDDVQRLPSLRTGAEIWSDRVALLAAFNVAVNPECNAAASANLIFTTIRIPLAVATGLAIRQANPALPPFDFRCADGGLGVGDLVLTPAEAAVANGLMAQIDAFIAQQAAQRGYAYVRLEAIYGAPGARPAFSSVAQMTTAQPYGPYVSLDGIHPSAAGQTLLAEAAAAAINARYDLGIPTTAAFVAQR
jgi:hypothetical protein